MRWNMIGETPNQAFLNQRDRLAVFSLKYDLFLQVIDECGLQSHRTQLVRARTIQTAPGIRTPFEVR